MFPRGKFAFPHRDQEMVVGTRRENNRHVFALLGYVRRGQQARLPEVEGSRSESRLSRFISCTDRYRLTSDWKNLFSQNMKIVD